MDNLTTLANSPGRGLRIYRGLIADDAVGSNDLVNVRIDSYDPSRSFGPCHWAPRLLNDGTPLWPMRNDGCLIALDENDQAEILNWWAEDPTSQIADIPYVTDLSVIPGGVVDGQRVFFVASAADNVVWHLRWKATDSRWEYLGGPSLIAEVVAEELQNVTGYQNLTGPSLVVPRSGLYEVIFEATARNAVLNTDAQVQVGLLRSGDSSPLTANLKAMWTKYNVDNGVNFGPRRRTFGQNETIRLSYLGPTRFYAQRSLAIRPVYIT